MLMSLSKGGISLLMKLPDLDSLVAVVSEALQERKGSGITIHFITHTWTQIM